MNLISKDLKNRGIQRCLITNPAECYSPRKMEILKKSMEKSGFSINRKAINHHIPIEEDSLEERMHPMERRRLNKCRNAGFIFREEPIEKAEEVYNYLAQCREEQKLKLSISKEKFFSYIEEFKQNYPFFTVRDQENILAATITIKTHRKILYSFLPGSLRKFKHFSPTVMLNEGLYRYGQEHDFEMLDLGISTEDDGTDQTSLIAFKERMGGKISYKYFFEKEL